MHYRNGREAKNGDKIVSLAGYGSGPVNINGIGIRATITATGALRLLALRRRCRPHRQGWLGQAAGREVMSMKTHRQVINEAYEEAIKDAYRALLKDNMTGDFADATRKFKDVTQFAIDARAEALRVCDSLDMPMKWQDGEDD